MLPFLGTWVRIPPIPPKNSTSFDLSNFFIHCESNGISSRRSRGYHHRRCISSAVGCIFFRNDDIQGFRLGDIQNFVLMIYTPHGVMWRTGSSLYQNNEKYLFCYPSPRLNRAIFCVSVKILKIFSLCSCKVQFFVLKYIKLFTFR